MRFVLALGLLSSLNVFALDLPANERPGTWVTHHRDTNSAEEAREACVSLATERREKSPVPYKFMGQNFSQVGSVFACNLDFVEYHQDYRGYLANLECDDDFDRRRSDELVYVMEYFAQDIEILREQFRPFQVEITKHRYYPQNNTVHFNYHVRFDSDFVPSEVQEKLYTDEGFRGYSDSEAEAIEHRDYVESILRAAYPEDALEIVARGVDNFLYTSPEGWRYAYMGWIDYRAKTGQKVEQK